MRDPKLVIILFNIFLVTLILGQLSRIPLPLGGEGAVFLSDFILTILVAVWLIWRLAERKRIVVSLLDWSIGLFAFATGLSLIFALHWLNNTEWIVAAFYWVRLVFYLCVFYISATLASKTRFTPLPLLEKTGFIFAVIGLVQFVIFPDFSKYVQHGWDPHYYRVLSTFFDPNYAGLLLTFSFFLTLELLYSDRNASKTVRLWRFLELATIGVADILTFSRSTYLALVIGLTIYGWMKDKRILIGMALFGALAFATIPRVRTRIVGAFQVDETAQLRLESYNRTWKIIADQPVLGVGFNAYRYAQDDYGYFRDNRGVNQESGHAGAGSDNSILFIWAVGGLLSLLSLLIWLAMLTVRSLSVPGSGFLLAILAAFIVHAQFVNSLFYTALLAWFLVTMGYYLGGTKGDAAKD